MSASMIATSTPSTEGAGGATEKRRIGEGRITLAQTVGERIKWARERKGLTQLELAKLSHKSRASIVQYEQDKIAAPLTVVEHLAEKLDVAPEFLAFGRSGISGVHNAEEEILTLEELSGHKPTLYTSGGWAIPRAMFEDYGASRGDLKAVCLGADEPKFDIHRGDRVIVDTKAGISKDGLYCVKTPFGARIIRVLIGFSSGAGVRIISGTDGSEEILDPATLELVGLVVGVFRRTF